MTGSATTADPAEAGQAAHELVDIVTRAQRFGFCRLRVATALGASPHELALLELIPSRASPSHQELVDIAQLIPEPCAARPFVVQCERVGLEHRVRPSGELDVATAPTLERALQAIELTGAQRIILDLRDLSFMDSTGVRLLLRANQRALADGHEFRLIAGSVAVQRPLQMTATLQRLPFIAAPVETVPRALKYAA
jgi:anti-anti-sigma factor